jgi:aminoglycoside phosphotransferase (APT) family kinase protein
MQRDTAYASGGLPELPLEGGDVTAGVVRVGDTVRRPAGEHSAAVRAFLLHLERAGFEQSPRFLGVDDRGRDVLTYIEGQMAGRPLQPWATDESIVRAIARMQRRLHDVAVDVRLPAGVAWSESITVPDVPPLFDAPDVVGHNDMTPENLIFRDRKLVGLIDFDLAGPTTRVLDIAATLLWWAPLRAPQDRDPLLRDADSGRRMRIFADEYGLAQAERLALLDGVAQRYARSWHRMRLRAERLGGGWQRMWDDGVGDVIKRGEAWYSGAREELSLALMG